MSHGGDRRSDQAANMPVEISQPEAAVLFNVSERTIRGAGVEHPPFLFLTGSIQGSMKNQKGLSNSPNPLILLVAGRGFEPLTFGL